MSAILKNLKFYCKSVIYGTVITGCAFYGVVASIALRVVGKKEYAQYTVARAFYHSLSLFLRLKINLKNEHYLKDNKPAIVISNHQSALDIYILGRIFQPGYTVTSKRALQYVPFLGWFMLASGTFFLDRKNGDKSRKVLEEALNTLKDEKRALFIFPEGTRSALKDLVMLPFKKGAFHLARTASIPIIPVVVSNTSNIFHAKDRVFNTGEITIEVLPPVKSENLDTPEAFSQFVEKTRESMMNKLEDLGYSQTSTDSNREAAKGSGTETSQRPNVPVSERSTTEVTETADVSSDELTPLINQN